MPQEVAMAWIFLEGKDLCFFLQIDLTSGYITTAIVVRRNVDLQIENFRWPSAQLPTNYVAPRSPRV